MKTIYVGIILSLFAVSCDDDSGGSMSTSEFSTKMATLQCDKFYTCCEDFGGWEYGSYDTYAECLAGEEDDMRALLESPNVIVNESKLADYYSAYANKYDVGCQEAIDYSYNDDLHAAQEAMLTGKLSPGSVCTYSAECARGYCDWTYEDMGECVAYPQLGEECDYYGPSPCDPSLVCDSTVSPAICMAPMNSGDDCLSGSYEGECFGDGLYCDQDTMKCVAQKDAGATCTDDPECLSYYCDGGSCADNTYTATIVDQQCTASYD